MLGNKWFLIFYLFTLQILFTPEMILAQQDTAKVKLIAADILEYNKSINPDYQILSGSVVFEYENALLYCDQAKIYIHKDLVITKGNVHIIVNDTTNMYGDSLRIDGDKELTELIGNVKLIDNDVTLTTDHLFYDFNRKIAYYLTGGEITDPSSYLTSQRGYYYQDSKDIFFSDSVYIRNEDETEMFSDSMMYNTKTEITRFYAKTTLIQAENTLFFESGSYDTKKDIGQFKENVRLLSGSRTLFSDSLYYNKILGYSEAYKNVVFTDSTDNIIVNSHYGKFFETDSSFCVTDSALLMIVDAPDTLYLHADSLILLNDTLIHMQKVLYAFNKARIWRFDFQAVSDSIVLLQNDSVLYMYKNPVMWMDKTQLVADTIILTYLDRQLDRLFLKENAFIISQEKTTDFQQIKSRDMEGIFLNNELDRLWANNESETLYYVFDNKMLLIGVNKTTSEKVQISFKENKVDNIVFYNSPKGTLFPENELSEKETILDGFKWEESARPKYPDDVFRNPEIEPEARIHNVFQNDTINVNDSTFISDSLFQDSLNKPFIDDNSAEKSRKPSKTDVNQAEEKESKNDQGIRKTKSNGKNKEPIELQEKNDHPKRCFIRRWISECREKRKQKSNNKYLST